MTAAILLLGFFGLLAIGLPVAIALAGAGVIFAIVDDGIPLLAIVHRIADGAGGSVDLEPSALGGLKVSVHLPVQPEDTPPRRGAAAVKR